MINKPFKRTLFLSLLLISTLAMAQVDDDGTAVIEDLDTGSESSPPVPGPPPPPGLPIDGGILAGIVVAIAYGAKKTLFDKEK